MAINHITNLPPTGPQGNQKRSESATQGQATQKDDTSPQGDVFQPTEKGTQLQQLEAKIARQPHVDAERVAQVKQALEQGHFQIDDESLADKLLAFESHLAQPQED